MTEPSPEQLDRLAEAARSGTREANNALWGAVFALQRWWSLPDGDPPGPRIGMLDGRPFLLAFTSGERARQQALAWGLAAPDGSVNVLSLTPANVLSMVDGLRSSGVFGIAFDHGISGFFAPLENLAPIFEHVRPSIPPERPVGGWYATYEGVEHQVDLLGSGDTVDLLSADQARLVPTADLTELYAVNLTATLGSAHCAIIASLGERVRVLTAAPELGWAGTERGIYENLVPQTELDVAGLRADLPLTPTGPPLNMQKVLTPAQTRSAMDGNLRHIAGYLNRTQDVLELRTPAALVDQLRLGPPFHGDGGPIAVLRFPLRDGTWRLENADMLPTPQYFVGAPHVMPMPAEAELLFLQQDGTQRLISRYGGFRAGWQPVS